MKWTKDSWKNFEAKQMPAYADQGNLDSVIEELSFMPPLIFAGETRSLKSKIYHLMNFQKLQLTIFLICLVN